jgi:uncharacterized phage-associated protein
MIKSSEFAKFIIEKAQSQNITLGETKLQKLLYICDGYMLAFGFNLIDERAKAWNYGPVYPRVHNWLEKNPDAIQKPQKCTDETLKKIHDTNIGSLVDFILPIYGKLSATTLSTWSHQPGSPWEKALAENGGIMNATIRKEDMQNYFKTFLKHAK